MDSKDFNNEVRFLDEFSLFPHLPAEIRLNIWRYCLSPQIVDVWTLGVEQKNQSKGIFLFTYSSRQIPLFHICPESRTLAQENHLFLLNSDVHAEKPVDCVFDDMRIEGNRELVLNATKNRKPREIFDPSSDVLFLHCGHVMQGCGGIGGTFKYLLTSVPDFAKGLGSEVIGRTKYIAMEGYEWTSVAAAAWSGLWMDFKNLDVIFVVVPGLYQDRIWDRFLELSSWGFDKLAENNPGWKRPRVKYVESRKELMEEIFT